MNLYKIADMYEKVNPGHPDKLADRIAGAMIDIAYEKQHTPRIAVEVLIGHGEAMIIAETSVHFTNDIVADIVSTIARPEAMAVHYKEVPQDEHLANNQSGELPRCGDNGIFKGVPISAHEQELAKMAGQLWQDFHRDGKYIITDEGNVYICQSHATTQEARASAEKVIQDTTRIKAVNPLGDWTGGIDVDSGATNRKLGSDMGRAVTGGGLHGKDLTKADVTMNIICHLRAQEWQEETTSACAIGDKVVTIKSTHHEQKMRYIDAMNEAGHYIFETIGGFERLAEWGLIHG